VKSSIAVRVHGKGSLADNRVSDGGVARAELRSQRTRWLRASLRPSTNPPVGVHGRFSCVGPRAAIEFCDRLDRRSESADSRVQRRVADGWFSQRVANERAANELTMIRLTMIRSSSLAIVSIAHENPAGRHRNGRRRRGLRRHGPGERRGPDGVRILEKTSAPSERSEKGRRWET
jgi:hypothetical protein